MGKKQYKHIQTGKIAQSWDIGALYSVENEQSTIPAWMIEKSQDWELITLPVQEEKEYTILQFKQIDIESSNNLIWYRADNGKFSLNLCSNGTQPLNSMLYGPTGANVKNGRILIWQVQRLSDGSVWTVGDEFSSKADSRPRTITKFTLMSGDTEVGIWSSDNDRIPDCKLQDCVQKLPVEPIWMIVELLPVRGSKEFPPITDKVNIDAWLEGYGRDGWHIHSARATPTSELITLEDWIQPLSEKAVYVYDGDRSQVTAMIVNEYNHLLLITSRYEKGINIGKVRKVDAPVEKKPLYTTEDNIQVYDKDQTVWTVSDAWTQSEEPSKSRYSIWHQGVLKPSSVWHVFSTRKAAQQYMNNKKQESIAKEEKGGCYVQVSKEQIETLREILIQYAIRESKK